MVTLVIYLIKVRVLIRGYEKRSVISGKTENNGF